MLLPSDHLIYYLTSNPSSVTFSYIDFPFTIVFRPGAVKKDSLPEKLKSNSSSGKYCSWDLLELNRIMFLLYNNNQSKITILNMKNVITEAGYGY